MSTRFNRRALVTIAAMVSLTAAAAAAELRPPSVPLVAHDPYFSVWSPADRLTDAWSVHWTGKRHALQSMVRVDDKTYRLAGPEPAAVPAMEQAGVKVLPTRTIYTFRSDEVQVVMTFMTPALPKDIDVMSRPVTYITWEIRSWDGKPHRAMVYLDLSPELTVNTPDQAVTWSRPEIAGLHVLRAGSEEQRILSRRGDDLRIEWGYLYLAAPKDVKARGILAAAEATRGAFAGGHAQADMDVTQMPKPAGQAPSLSMALDYGRVGDVPVSHYMMVAYDDLYSIRYFGSRLRPYWRRGGAEASDLLQTAAREYAKLASECESFDETLMQDMVRAGGEKYAQIAALAYRQCLAANKIAADANGQPLLFSKENFSNGCIATVDICYPMAPQFLLTSPALMKAAMVPVLDYASSPRWKFPFAPHDLGTYPFAEGQVYGGGEVGEENQMPVEESGNMLILMAALAKIEGNAEFSARYWPVLSKWAEYLVSKGFDPEKQLCTDDFAGHLAHNVNLSAKATMGLASYAMLCEMLGKKDEAAAFRKTAEENAANWVRLADDGDHYRLAFDRAGTWSQKYNLVWDRLLGLNVFPPEVVKKEMAYYRKVQKKYGLPLDNRETYTKLDWIVWTATLTGSREDFDALVAPVWAFLNETPNRVPMTDWYRTTDARHVGFQARSVVGGVFIKMLDDMATWKKYAGRAAKETGPWAPLPKPPEYKVIVPTSQKEGVAWRYTFEKPAGEWFAPGFDDAAWKQGPGGFGTRQTPGEAVRTEWNTPDVWLRREFTLPEGDIKNPLLFIHHDEDAAVYINGVEVAKIGGYTTQYEAVDLSPKARAALKPGKNVIAVHCHQTDGGQYIDVGIVDPK